MKRILVIGCCGAGKTVFSRALEAKLGFPVVHLDRIFWLPGWKERPRDEYDALLEKELQQECWIIDGNHSRTFARRLEIADAVFFLRFSRFRCLSGILWRWIQYYGRTRPDSGDGCPEKIDLPFLRFVWNYNRNTLPKMLLLLEQRPASCRLIELKSRREAQQVLESL